MNKRIFFILFLGAILLPHNSWAETRYIGDTIVVSLRNGPGSSFSVVKTLRTGDQIKVLQEQGNYIQVTASDNSEGWIQKQYTITEPPDRLVVPKLREKLNQLILSNKHFSKKITELKKQLAQKDEEFQSKHQEIIAQDSADQAELTRLQQALEQKTSQYDTLSEESKQFIDTKNERDTLKKDVTTLRARVASLDNENNSMANKQVIYWFLAGGGVLFVGWLIGISSAKKRRPTLSL